MCDHASVPPVKSMKKFPILFLLLLSCYCSSTAQEATVDDKNILLQLKDDHSVEQVIHEAAYLKGVKTDLKLQRIVSRTLHIYLFEYNYSAVEANVLLATLKANPLVVTAQFDHPVYARNLPNDPEIGYQWHLQNTGQNNGIPGADIEAAKAWDLTTGGNTSTGDTIVLAVIDDGFGLAHQDLNFWKNYQEIPYNGLDDDLNGYIDDFNGWNPFKATDSLPLKSHGTMVCGIAGAKGNNGIGVTGVNWNLKIMPVSYTGGSNFESTVIAGYAYVLDQRKAYNKSNGTKGAFIVAANSSFGIDFAKPDDHPIWCSLYDSMGVAGILNIAATANKAINVDNDGDMPTTCTSPWLITVTNTDNTDLKNTGAAYGAQSVDLGAPGTNITSTFPVNGYYYDSGCSFSAPMVAGAITLMYSLVCKDFMEQYKKDPPGIALQIKDSLLRNVDVLPDLSGKTLSNGRLNLYKSVRAVNNYCGIVDPPVSEEHFNILSVYPVPAFDQLTIDYTSDVKSEIYLTSILGQEILRIPCNTSDIGIIQHVRIGLAGLSKGVYFIRLQSNTKKTKSIKIIL